MKRVFSVENFYDCITESEEVLTRLFPWQLGKPERHREKERERTNEYSLTRFASIESEYNGGWLGVVAKGTNVIQ